MGNYCMLRHYSKVPVPAEDDVRVRDACLYDVCQLSPFLVQEQNATIQLLSALLRGCMHRC